MNYTRLLAAAAFSLSLVSCLDNGDETITLAQDNSTDIPSDSNAKPNPILEGGATASMPNIQYSTVDEDGTAVFRIDMTGIQDRNTLEWLRLYGTGEKDQNIWVEVDDTPKGIKVYNTVDDEEERTVPVDLVFLVDNSGSMSDEANVIARDISDWASRLNAGSLDIMFGCVGYDGAITGALNLTSSRLLSEYLDRSTGTDRTVGFEGSDADIRLFNDHRAEYTTAGNAYAECGMAALRFATDLFSFRPRANRIFVNFTDEPNQPEGIYRFSVESLLTDWDTSLGTIHTVFSGSSDTSEEPNSLMSEYTGGIVLYTNASFTGITLDSLPVTGALQNSYIIRLTNIQKYIDGRTHRVHITIRTPDGAVQVERFFDVVFLKAEVHN